MNRLWHSDTVEAMRYPYEKNLITKEKREKTLPGQQYWQDCFPVESAVLIQFQRSDWSACGLTHQSTQNLLIRAVGQLAVK